MLCSYLGFFPWAVVAFSSSTNFQVTLSPVAATLFFAACLTSHCHSFILSSLLRLLSLPSFQFHFPSSLSQYLPSQIVLPLSTARLPCCLHQLTTFVDISSFHDLGFHDPAFAFSTSFMSSSTTMLWAFNVIRSRPKPAAAYSSFVNVESIYDSHEYPRNIRYTMAKLGTLQQAR